MPTSDDFALQAQEAWLVENHQERIDPWVIPNPGDAIMRISRDIEYAIYKRAEVRFRAAQVLRTVSASMDLVHRSEEHTSELQSLMRISYAVFCFTKNHNTTILIC